MLFFIGCSFTWGAGLEYEYLHSEQDYIAELDEYNLELEINFANFHIFGMENLFLNKFPL